MVRNLLNATGSRIDDRGVALYRRLISDAGHVDATLAMMAQWELSGLRRRLGEIRARTLLLAGGRDQSVPPSVSREAAEMIPGAELEIVEAGGHLLHETDPGMIAAAVRRFEAGR